MTVMAATLATQAAALVAATWTITLVPVVMKGKRVVGAVAVPQSLQVLAAAVCSLMVAATQAMEAAAAVVALDNPRR